MKFFFITSEIWLISGLTSSTSKLSSEQKPVPSVTLDELILLQILRSEISRHKSNVFEVPEASKKESLFFDLSSEMGVWVSNNT